MANGLVDPVLDGLDTFLAWISSGTKATIDSNCEIQTADSPTVLVTNDGSLLSVIRVDGVSKLIGPEEFNNISKNLLKTLSPFMSNEGHCMQVVFSYDQNLVSDEIYQNYAPTRDTIKRLGLSLEDLVAERRTHLSKYCASEEVYLVIWTKVESLSREQLSKAMAKKTKQLAGKNAPVFRYTQNILAAIPDLRDSHDSSIKSVITNAAGFNLKLELLEVHDAIKAIRNLTDRNFTDPNWSAVLPGDRIRPKLAKSFNGDLADLTWPAISKQIFPRDGYNFSIDSTAVGDYAYGTVFIDLFPLEMQSFNALLSRLLHANIPWRISYLMESGGVSSVRMKKALSTILAFSSSENRLIANGIELLEYIELNTDDSSVKLQVSLCTWAPRSDPALLKVRTSILARAVEGWGSCDVSQICGDPFEGYIATLPAVSSKSPATATIASLSDSIQMLPLFRPTSPWDKGALLFRSPDGKIWPYQPGSPIQTTAIDLIYARPGSGKSVLSNALNLALCLMGGLKRLPRVSIVDIGPSSSGLISLLKEALPPEQRHLAAYHRMRMTEEYSINPFDTQLGCRYAAPAERAFLVNFITLLATPVGKDAPYDGLSDMVGLVVDEAYKSTADDANPHIYTMTTDPEIDAILQDMGFVSDSKTSWWEVVDALFIAGFVQDAMRAQRYAMPLISDLASICRTGAVEDLYGKITTPTGESLIAAFARMISSSIREYPVLSRYTKFDISGARVVSLDLDEVAKAGGAQSDRQTAVMYMLARYVLTKEFYLNVGSIAHAPDAYRSYHESRVADAQEDPKRLVFDEFHRTSKALAVRNQVVEDMREGRKWRVQVALLSQSIEDFDSIMVDFATSIFVMDAGPEQAIQKTQKTFGLSQSAVLALRNYVRGPGEGGATMLGQFATKKGTTTQLITLTLGPIELWAFSTTTEDYILRNKLYDRLGPVEARKLLARIFPSGSAAKFLLARAQKAKDTGEKIDSKAKEGLVSALADELVSEYRKNPNFSSLTN